MNVSQSMFLNKVLQTKDFSIITLNNLDSKYFYTCKAEFEYIKNHYDLYKAVPDILTFKNSFPDFDVIDVSEPNNFLVEQVINDYKQSALVETINKSKNAILTGNFELAAKILTNAVEEQSSTNVLSCTDIFEDTSRYDHYLERTSDQEKYYLTTSFNELDAAVGGIDRKNENMVIIARSGQGKTQIMLKMAAEASKQGLRVGIYEGEMTADKVGYRLDTYFKQISNKSLNRGDIYVQKEYKNYIDSLKALKYGPIKIMTLNDIPSGNCTVDTLRTFIEKEKLDILFIDQYDLMEDVSNARVEHERVANIAKAVKKLQVEKQIPIISVCQMNRTKNENGEQDTTQVAGSDKVARYATIILGLDQKYDEANKEVKMVINVIKARDGGDHNKLIYRVDFDKGIFQYLMNDKDGISTEADFNKEKDSYRVEENSDGLAF